MAKIRCTVSLPEDLARAADRVAAEFDHSRSRVISDALRVYLTAPTSSDPASPSLRSAARPLAVSERAVRYLPGLDTARVTQLEADLQLSVEQRVRAAEQTALVSELAGPAALRDRIIGFDRIEDFFSWERNEALRK